MTISMWSEGVIKRIKLCAHQVFKFAAKGKLVAVLAALTWLSGCFSGNAKPDTSRHLSAADLQKTQSIPEVVKVLPPSLPEPSKIKNERLHTVVVHDVPVTELLFSLARDANINLDIDSDITTRITLNAVNQPLMAIIDRVAEKAQLRYESTNHGIYIRKDKPFLKSYRIDYLNMERESSSKVSVSTQISSTGQGAVSDGGGGGGDNSSDTSVVNKSSHLFWQTLAKNVGSILGSPQGEQQGASHPDILLNKEGGVMAVRATYRQHKEIQHFLSEIMFASQRQVLIEATIVEVTLSERYQAGIDWSVLQQNVADGVTRTATQDVLDVTLQDPVFTITHVGKNLSATVKALDTFGDVSVMSSPKVMTLNNQTALLKVVDNLVYFTVDVNIETNESGPSTTTFETEVNTVPIGFVMSVTPFINEFGYVTLNIRPTISRVIGLKRDPNPALAQVNVVNEIPEIQVREVESVLKIPDGEVAIIGGLMQDEQDNTEHGVPGLSKIPLVGGLFKYTDDKVKKSELVIFIKPIVVDYSKSSRVASEKFPADDWY